MCASEYKRPVSVMVVVYSRTGEVLLLRRKTPTDFWQSVTGSLKWDESKEQAAARELQEETGLKADHNLVDCQIENRFSILPEWRSRYAPDVDHNLEYVFSLELPAPCEISINLDEHQQYEWLPWRQAVEKASSWTNQEAISALSLP